MNLSETLSRRGFGRLLGAGAIGSTFGSLATSGVAFAEDFPTKPVEMFVGWPPGGVADISARMFADYAGEIFGNMVIHNRPGATGSIAARHVARAKPDGYNLLFAANPEICINRFISGDKSFDPDKDLTPIIGIYTTTLAVLVAQNSPYHNLGQLIDAARAAPGAIRFASNGTGAPAHLAGEALALEAGIQLKHIPFQGGAPAVTAVLGGHVECCIITVSTARANINDSTLRVLAVTGRERAQKLPDVPTVGEVLGNSKFDFSAFAGIFAPGGIQRERSDKIFKAFNEIAKDKKIIEHFERNDLDYPSMNSHQFAEFIKEQIALNGSLIKKLGISKIQ